MNSRHRALTRPLILMSLAAAPLPAIAQERESRPLTGFNAVEVGGGIDLFLRQGDVFAVEVEAEDGDVAEIVTELRDDTLVIRRKSSFGGFFSWGDDDGAVRVTLPALVALTASGGSDATTEGTFSSDDLELTASGGSDLAIDVAVASLQAQASGGSDMRLSGSARAARVHASGGSDLDASRLTVEEADVHSSGGSDLSIAVRDRIIGDASGGSDITYTGSPQTIDVDTSGGADVRRR